ncbi:hypothetical protein DAEQUDRAFT_723957 [Daedalea quercina L-15889]|uniref:Arf-GAP domain-containing protein n=1 Tax=Daedalea quercina L-15889 TaxID=1314783 RepID=A0A165S2G7_9APHY|nr:hypothetical protein DAEQUDRAFT_723957 [Daedalea quercina L-15889]
MDTWQEEQIKRMQLGGNSPFREFMKTYPADTGGYTQGMNSYDTYHSWAASQYREKLDSELAGKPWAPSVPPEGFGSPNNTTSPPGRPSSAQGLRKSRASARNSTGRAASPASFGSRNSPAPSSPMTPSSAFDDQKARNESYFAGLGQANASRPEDLPPSQGGRYQGFGSTPAPSQPPSYGLSSRAAPTLSDLQENPSAALSKGWSLFSAAIAGATKAVSENVIQPGVEKVMDPNFQQGVKGYVSEASKRAAEAGRSANMWGKSALGVDVAEQVGGVVGTVKDKVTGGPVRRGYSSVGPGGDGETSALYQDHDDDEDFFNNYSNNLNRGHDSLASQVSPISPAAHSAAPVQSAKKDEDWDEWKDF